MKSVGAFMRRTASSAPQKEVLTVEGAWHAAAKAKDPENYYRHVFAFADRWTN